MPRKKQVADEENNSNAAAVVVVVVDSRQRRKAAPLQGHWAANSHMQEKKIRGEEESTEKRKRNLSITSNDRSVRPRLRLS